jgi:hypothetical protein
MKRQRINPDNLKQTYCESTIRHEYGLHIDGNVCYQFNGDRWALINPDGIRLENGSTIVLPGRERHEETEG